MPDYIPFELPIQVTASDIDAMNHVNNVAFLRFVQDAAAAHWLSLASPELHASVAWVVRKHEIEYLRPGKPEDHLIARTWVGEPSAATWDRFTEIVRRDDGQLLVTARTVWVLIDRQTGRPRRVDARITEAFHRPG